MMIAARPTSADRPQAGNQAGPSGLLPLLRALKPPVPLLAITPTRLRPQCPLLALFPRAAATLRWSAYRGSSAFAEVERGRGPSSEFEYTASVLLESTAQFSDSGHSIEPTHRVAFPTA